MVHSWLSFANWASETLAPGGWLQIQEMDLSAGRTEDPSAFNEVLQLFEAVFEAGGMGGRFSSKLDESFIKAGLKNVTLQRLEIPAGKRIVDEKLAQLSIEPFKLTIPTVIGAARGTSFSCCPDRTSPTITQY